MPVVLHINGKTWSGGLSVTDRTVSRIPLTLTTSTTTPTADASKYKFGGASVRINDGVLFTADARALIGPTEDFTIRGWFQWESHGTQFPALFAQRATTGYSPIQVYRVLADGTLVLRADSQALTSFIGTCAFAPTLGTTWYYIEVGRSGRYMRLFLDGIKVIELDLGATNTALYSTSPFVIGGTDNNDYRLQFNGRFDDFQVIRGECLHTADFTPPGELDVPDAGDGPYYHPATLLGPMRAAGYTPPASVAFKRLPLQERSIRPHLYYGGRGIITGTVKIKGTPDAPTHRKVWLMRERDGVVIAETWSNAATAAYAFPYIDERERYSAFAFDYEHNFRAVIADNLIPDLMP